ncbi:MAG: AAA family ATPase [Clostridia bacterium]|nr:AAA family ATPase [Clostridia bacterium]
MNTTEEIKERLDNFVETLDNFIKEMESNKSELENDYKDSYYFHPWIDIKGIEHKLKLDEFDNTYQQNIMYVNKQKDFINRVKELSFLKENKLSKQMKELLDNCLNEMGYDFNNYSYENLLYGFTFNKDYSEEYAPIFILSKFSEFDDNIVLIGGNGSGKSTLAKSLKGDDQENISVIPAQKTLYFSLNDKSMLAARSKELENILLENNIGKSKTEDDYGYFQFQNNQFTKLIVAMREEYMKYLMTCEEEGCVPDKEKSIFGVLRKIFKTIFSDIELSFKPDNEHYMNCTRNGNTYHINALSEGEKAVMYYAISVLMARENSFIVVDEPETYLNPSLTNVLWDILIKEREDCQFIFITHSVDFVLGRSDSKIAWIKNFQYPNTWEFEFVEDNFTLPKTMLTEVLGSPKAIAFCEGDDKSSIDYKVYRSVLGAQYTIIPVGGHLNVIKYCEVLSKSDWIARECIGIVDGDNFTVEKIQELAAKKIIVLPFNEIEMFLLSDLVIDYTMQAVRPVDAHNRVADFKEKFWAKVSERKEKIILTTTKNVADEYIQKEKIQRYDSLENIKSSISHIAAYDVDSVYSEFSEKVTKVIEDQDYDKLLNLCNLKKEITCGIANVLLDSDYEDKAIQQIATNKELQAKLLEKYFQLQEL